jgi:VWFA-related protein
LAGIVVASAVLAIQGQEAPPQIRTGVELITLDVAVLDDDRQPVRGLTEADFTVRENGVVRPIRAFTPIDLGTRPPASTAVWAGGVPQDVVTNQAGEQEGRLLVILMDRSIPPEQPTQTARKVAAAAIESLGPSDLGAVVTTSNGAVQNLTSDKTRLLKAINAGDPSTGLTPEQLEVMGKFVSVDSLGDGRCLCGLCVLETIERVADAARHALRRRKTLLFIGNIVIWQSARPIREAGEDPGCETRLKDARNAMFAAVDRASLTVHAIDPMGLSNISLYRGGISGSGTDSGGSAGRVKAIATETTARVTNQQSLQVLPDRTGGRTIVNSNEPERTVPAILRESEAYYVLGFERGTAGRPEEPRDVEVRVSRKGVRVVAPRQYVLPPGMSSPSSAPASIENALTQLLPAGRVPLSMAVTAFADPDKTNGIVRVNVDARAFAHRDGSAATLDVALKAVTPTGVQIASGRQTATITGTGTGAEELNIPSQFELPPGDYGIRLAIADAATGAVSSVFADVTVPSFHNAPLSLSSVAVDVARGDAAPVQTTRRTFAGAERVRAVMQIYQGTRRTDPVAPVSVRVQILDAKGSAVRDQSMPFDASAFTNRRADCVITLPLANLPAGEYLLKLDASLGRQAAGRTMRFAVE